MRLDEWMILNTIEKCLSCRTVFESNQNQITYRKTCTCIITNMNLFDIHMYNGFAFVVQFLQ